MLLFSLISFTIVPCAPLGVVNLWRRSHSFSLGLCVHLRWRIGLRLLWIRIGIIGGLVSIILLWLRCFVVAWIGLIGSHRLNRRGGLINVVALRRITTGIWLHNGVSGAAIVIVAPKLTKADVVYESTKKDEKEPNPHEDPK